MEDLPFLYDICYKTGDKGSTVEGQIDDLYTIGHYFAAPYLYCDLSCCFVATVDNIPKGYIVGSANTEKYTRWLNSSWLPKIRKYYNFEEMKPFNDFDQFLNDVIRKAALVMTKSCSFLIMGTIDVAVKARAC